MKKYLLIIITLIIIFFDGCTTYDDGPWISFRSKYKRISGIWEVKTFEVDGIDSLALYNQVSNYSTIEIILHNHSPEISSFLMSDINGKQYRGGTIDFLDLFDSKSDSISISLLKNDSILKYQSIGSFIENTFSHWKINRLSFNKLWISTIHNNRVLYLKLNKIEKIKHW